MAKLLAIHMAIFGAGAVAVVRPHWTELSLLQTRAGEIRTGAVQDVGLSLFGDDFFDVTDENASEAIAVGNDSAAFCTLGRKVMYRGTLPPIAQELKIVDATGQSVQHIVSIVNDTTHKVLSMASKTTQGLSSALLEAKHAADGLKAVLGEDSASASSKLFERLSEAVEPVPSLLAESEGKMQVMLVDTVAQFEAAGAQLKERIRDAAAALAELGNATTPAAASLLQKETFIKANGTKKGEAAADGVFDWLANTFGVGGTPCRHAKSAISDADQMVHQHMRLMSSLNTTLCSSFLEGAVGQVREVTSRLEDVMETGLKTYAASMPNSLRDTVRNALAATQKAIQKTEAKVHMFEAKVADAIVVASGHLSALRETMDTFSACTDGACSN